MTHHAKSWLIGKDSDAGRDWGQEEKGTTEDEMAGWHHWLNGREFEWTPGDGDEQGGLACCDSWDCKESDMTKRLNWTELNDFLSWLTLKWILKFPLTYFLPSIYLKHCISTLVNVYKEYIVYFTTKMGLNFYEYFILYIFSVSIFCRFWNEFSLLHSKFLSQ